MRALFGLVVVCVLFGVCVADHRPYRYNISLDETPEKRYYPVVFDLCRDPKHRTAIETLLYALDHTLIAKLSQGLGGEEQLYATAAGIFQKRLPEVLQELNGISHYFKKYCNKDLPAGKLATFQLIYHLALQYVGRDVERDTVVDDDELLDEIAAKFQMGCTSIIAANSSGHVIHGRNLDWPDGTLYEPLTTELTFFRGGEPVAVTTSFFPELSPTTLVSPELGFSYDARTCETNPNPLCLVGKETSMEPFQLQIRDRVFKGQNYNEIFQQLNTTYCSPAYIVISGPGEYEGALFTTHVNELPDVKEINTEYEDEGDPRKPWFVAVCNDDIDFENASEWEERYNLTIQHLIDSEQDVMTSSIENLDTEVLNTTKIRRDNRTCYMSVFDTLNFEYKTVVRSLTVSEDQFTQDTNIPPEVESSSSSSSKPAPGPSHSSHHETSSKSGASSHTAPSTTSNTTSLSGGARLSFAPVVYVLLAVCAVIISRI